MSAITLSDIHFPTYFLKKKKNIVASTTVKCTSGELFLKTYSGKKLDQKSARYHAINLPRALLSDDVISARTTQPPPPPPPPSIKGNKHKSSPRGRLYLKGPATRPRPNQNTFFHTANKLYTRNTRPAPFCRVNPCVTGRSGHA